MFLFPLKYRDYGIILHNYHLAILMECFSKVNLIILEVNWNSYILEENTVPMLQYHVTQDLTNETVRNQSLLLFTLS